MPSRIKPAPTFSLLLLSLFTARRKQFPHTKSLSIGNPIDDPSLSFFPYFASTSFPDACAFHDILSPIS